MKVSPATIEDAADWTDFVKRHAGATVFHQWGWQDLLRQSFGHKPRFLIARSDDVVVGVLPLAEVQSLLFGHSLVSLPFCSWSGPLSSSEDAENALLAKAGEIADQNRIGQLEIRSWNQYAPSVPTQDLYVYFTRQISADHDENMKAIPRKQRAMVRKGIKAGLTSEPGSLTDFYSLYLNNVHRHGTPGCPISFFEGMKRQFSDDCEILIVRDRNGLAISGVLSLYFGNEVLPFYAGDLPEARNTAANDFKYWEVMRRAADRGATQFNFGRSKKHTGSYSFKKNWGFDPTPLHYQYFRMKGTEIPGLNPSNPKFQLLIATWRKLPAWLVSRLGPRLIRGLG